MNIPVPVSDWELNSEIWNIEGHSLTVESISALHPTIQHGLVLDEFVSVLPSELYGMIRSWKPVMMMITPSDPIYICLIYDDSLDVDYYYLRQDEFFHMKSYFVGNIEKADWIQEGF